MNTVPRSYPSTTVHRVLNTSWSKKVSRFGVLLVFIAFLLVPIFSASTSSLSSKANHQSGETEFNTLTAIKPPAPALFTKGAPTDQLSTYESMLFLSPQGPGPEVTIYESDCTTPKTVFNLQDADKTVCAKVNSAAPASWRIIWSNANSVAVQNAPFGTGTNTFTLTAASSKGDWRVILFEPFGGSVQDVKTFTVTDEANPTADLAISKSLFSGNAPAGGQAIFSVHVTNLGPSSVPVQVSDAIPTNTSFVSFDQLSGPVFTCTSPTAGSSDGTTICTIGSLARGESATFLAVYEIAGVANGTVISNTADVSSSIEDQNPANNSSTAELTVGTTPCLLTTPENITVEADAGQAGATVTYTEPTGSGDCGQPTTGENGETIPPISCHPSSGSFFPVGTTTVICSAQSGAAVSFQVTVNNPGALSISLSGANPLAVECGDDFNDPGASAINGSGQSLEVLVTFPAGFDPLAPAVGSYTITYTATEDTNSVSTTRVVNVSDNQAPSITVDGANPYRIQQGSCSPFVDPGATAFDACAGAKPVTTSISGPAGNTVDPNVPGTYTVTYTATDGARTATATRTVLVGMFPDDETDQPGSSNVPPTITLNGPDEIQIECGTPFTDPGATATVCGASIAVTTTGVVDTHTPGIYSLTYSATANGFTSETTRIVTVEADNTAPTITLNGPNPLTVECHTGFTDPGAIAVDACAGNFGATASGAVDPNTVGQYIITYNATDPSGNAATPVTRTVNVVDTTAPVVTAPPSLTVYTGPGNASCTVVVDDASLGAASAVDSCQGPLATTRNGVPAGNIFPVGTTTITYSATDAANNVGSAVQTVIVIDNTPPTISCPANIVADFDPAVNGALVSYTEPAGLDNCSATTTQIAGLPSGSVFPVGTTTNTFRVTDTAGQSAECSFDVTVAITSIVGLDSVSITGAALVDSYESAGGYPASKGSLANILSNGAITVGGSALVFGNVRSTRAAVNVSGTSQITGNATAGTTVTKGASAIIGGTIAQNQLAPLMTLPSVVACGPPYSPNSGISGTYSYNPSTGNLSLTGIQNAMLAPGTYCFNNLSLANSTQLRVSGPVVIKLTGTLSVGGATTIANTTTIPSNLRILSSYSGTNGVTFANSSNAHLMIFAPNTRATISGSAPLFGTVVGKTITISNSGKIHYDMGLKNTWPEIWPLVLGP